MKSFNLLLVWTAVAAAAFAQDNLLTLVSPIQSMAAGSDVVIELVVFNPARVESIYHGPATLRGQLSGEGQQWKIALRGTSGDTKIPAGGFARIPLAITLPADAAGQLVLAISQPAPASAVIQVRSDATAQTLSPGVHPVAAPATSLTASPAAVRVQRYYADHFSGHEPIYFVGGLAAPAVKFQFSFKYRLLNDDGPLATRLPALKGLHVAFTQRSLWDIKADSSPFFDTSYMPEVMFQSLVPDDGRRDRLFSWLGYQAGIQHESNGRARVASRSLNIAYFRPVMAFGDLEGWRLILAPKFYVPVGDLHDNPDLLDYRGYAELRAVFGKNDSFAVSVLGRVGKKFQKGSAQVDLTYPTKFLSGNFAMYLLVQYWTGYGESLILYNQHSSTVRAGFSLVR